jgi:hypothetical protein
MVTKKSGGYKDGDAKKKGRAMVVKRKRRRRRWGCKLKRAVALAQGFSNEDDFFWLFFFSLSLHFFF